MAKFEILNEEKVVKRLSLSTSKEARVQFLKRTDNEQSLDVIAPPDEKIGKPLESVYLLAVTQASGRWVVMALPNSPMILVNQVPLVGLKLLDHDDKIRIKEFDLCFKIKHSETLTAESDLVREGKACPFCLGNFVPDDVIVLCPVCELAHHEECLSENGSCSSYPFCGYVVPLEDN